MNDVLIVSKADKRLRVRAKRKGLQVVITDGNPAGMEFDRALIVAPGTVIPWDLIKHGLHFLQRWDAAAPLWRYGKTAADVGGPGERKRTQKITRDLRILLYSHELLFVRDSPDGRAMLVAWQKEMADGGEPRLAFLRAVYRVKPLFLALPRTWLSEVKDRRTDRRHQQPSRSKKRKTPMADRINALVKVEIAPGRYVRCKPGEEEETLRRWRKVLKTRRGEPGRRARQR